MRFDDGAADGQSHARSMQLGGKERIEHPVRMLLRQSHPGIANRHHQLLVFRPLRPDS